jgi:hypothetical protein
MCLMSNSIGGPICYMRRFCCPARVAICGPVGACVISHGRKPMDAYFDKYA